MRHLTNTDSQERELTKAYGNETINKTAVNQTLPPSISTGSDATLLQPRSKTPPEKSLIYFYTEQCKYLKK